METIQMNLSQKQKAFPEFFCALFKSTVNFEDFQKKIFLIADVFPKLRTPKDVVRKMSKKSRLIGPLDRQDGKRAETLIQFQRELFYHIHLSLGRWLSRKKSL